MCICHILLNLLCIWIKKIQKLRILCLYLYICMFMHIYVHALMCSYLSMFSCVWGQMTTLDVVPQVLAQFFEIGLLLTWKLPCRPGWQVSEIIVSASLMLDCRLVGSSCLLYMVSGDWTQTSHLQVNHITTWAISLSLTSLFKLLYKQWVSI